MMTESSPQPNSTMKILFGFIALFFVPCDAYFYRETVYQGCRRPLLSWAYTAHQLSDALAEMYSDTHGHTIECVNMAHGVTQYQIVTCKVAVSLDVASDGSWCRVRYCTRNQDTVSSLFYERLEGAIKPQCQMVVKQFNRPIVGYE